MQNKSRRVVILGTGGTIAGSSSQAADNVGYRAGQIGVAQLLAAIPALQGQALEAEQVAQLDSKDMSHAVWQLLAQRVQAHLDRPEVAGVVITHGTDTLEETAWFLHRVLMPSKPVVLTAAMRPASSLQADGPQNLLDALALAAMPNVQGVLAMLAGQVHGAAALRKWHPYRIDAFNSGDDGPLARLEEGVLRPLRAWPQGTGLGLALVSRSVADWPEVVVISSHAGLSERWVAAQCHAWVAAGVQGLVIEGTGNGTVHQVLEEAARAAMAQGLMVLRASRCLGGDVVGEPAGALPSAAGLGPAKARVELLLQLLSRTSA
jgi:L-asparaginase